MAGLVKSFEKLELHTDKKSIINLIKGIIDGDRILCSYLRFRKTFFLNLKCFLMHIIDRVDERKLTVEMCKAYLRENGH